MTKLIHALDLSVPRYTSYPPAPHFVPITEDTVKEHYRKADLPLSLYFHIPFCRTMCLFCACSVILNRKPEKQAEYVDLLKQEIALVRSAFQKKPKVEQLHFGGGTPTSLTTQELQEILTAIHSAFAIDKEAEISIEIDPRTVFADGGEKLAAIRHMGFNRVSFGVQDLNPDVQEAIRRRQTEEMTVVTYNRARALHFDGINIDLIYGLPLQTPEKFASTIDRIIDLLPDRIALFSYAHVPWMKEHQKAIDEKELPAQETKWEIYLIAREKLIRAGYIAIGLDHFARPEEPLSKAYLSQMMTRNFQGYSAKPAEPLIGFGITAIGQVEGCYMQNVKTIEEYRERIQNGKLPCLRGYVLNKDDTLRKWVIQSLMCQFKIDKRVFEERFGIAFDPYFETERNLLRETELTLETDDSLTPTEEGKLLIRLVASKFDAYMTKNGARYSKI